MSKPEGGSVTNSWPATPPPAAAAAATSSTTAPTPGPATRPPDADAAAAADFPPQGWTVDVKLSAIHAARVSSPDVRLHAWNMNVGDGAIKLSQFVKYPDDKQKAVYGDSPAVAVALDALHNELEERSGAGSGQGGGGGGGGGGAGTAAGPGAGTASGHEVPALPTVGGTIRANDEFFHGHPVVLIPTEKSLDSAAAERGFPSAQLPRATAGPVIVPGAGAGAGAGTSPSGVTVPSTVPPHVQATVNEWGKPRAARRALVAALRSAPSSSPPALAAASLPPSSAGSLESAIRAVSATEFAAVVPLSRLPDWKHRVNGGRAVSELHLERAASSHLVSSALSAATLGGAFDFKANTALTGMGFFAAVRENTPPLSVFSLDKLEPDLCVYHTKSLLVQFMYEAKALASSSDHPKGLGMTMASLLRYLEVSRRLGEDSTLADTVLPLVRIEGSCGYIEACWLETKAGQTYHTMYVGEVEKPTFDLDDEADRLRFNEILFNMAEELRSREGRLKDVKPVMGVNAVPSLSKRASSVPRRSVRPPRHSPGRESDTVESKAQDTEIVGQLEAVGLHVTKCLTDKAYVVMKTDRLIAKVLPHKYAKFEMVVGTTLATAYPAVFVQPMEMVKISEESSVLLLPYVENIYPDDNGVAVIIPNILQAAHDLLTAVATMAECKVLHRDLKPWNVLWLSDGHVKVVDFDLAKQLAGEDVGSTSYCGTDGWMAPEVEAVKAAQDAEEAPVPYSYPVDVWGAGKVLEWAMGKVGASVVVPEKLAKLVDAMCNPDPKHRPKAADALKAVHAMLCPEDEAESHGSPLPTGLKNPGDSPGL